VAERNYNQRRKIKTITANWSHQFWNKTLRRAISDVIN